MKCPKRLHERVILLGFVLATLAVSIAIVVTSRPPISADIDYRRQLSIRSIITQFRDPKSVADKTPTPHFWKYAYIIVNYHKSGHALSDILVKHINSNLNQFGRPLKRMKVQPRGNFNSQTKCSEMSFAPGTITVIGGPELHCSTEQLKDILLSHPDPKQPKWGVKVIHLVRNPFTMAVSNYNYHKQDPTPEPFVHWKNPCDAGGVGRYTLKDLTSPLLAQPKVKIRVRGQLPRIQPIMKREDFNAIADDCSSLYQTKPGMENATFYEHLRKLDSIEGLRMATADKINNIVLMAVDLIQFKRVRELVKASNPNHINGDMEVKTISMDDFIHQPGRSMYQVYDFVFKDLLSEETKISRSNTYEQSYLSQRESNHYINNHITYGKFDNTAALIEYLRGEPIFGPPLTKIEALLDEILYEESVGMERAMHSLYPSH